MRPVIALHLGVHKTATTYIQSRLSNSREILKENGIAYIPLEETRNLITAKISDESEPQKLLESLRPYMEYDRLILSDENIIGGTNKPKRNKIYPNARMRVGRILTAFLGYDIEIYITLRNYVDYFVSRYAESLRHFPFMDFDSYHREIDFSTVSWLQLIDSVRSAGATKLTITDFGELFRDEQAYFDLLVGTPGIVLESADNNPATRRAKFSQQGYDVVKYFAQHFSPGSAKKIMRMIDHTHQETAVTPFMPFDKEQSSVMTERYSNEIAMLRENSDVSVTVTSF